MTAATTRGRKNSAGKRRQVQEYFSTIAGRYDLADGLLTFGLHHFWRRQALRILGLQKDDRVLDLCGGTGDFALRAFACTGGPTVVCDLNRPMMEAGKKRARSLRIGWVQGNAEELGFLNDSFDAVIVGFGVRNMVDRPKGLKEMFRVLREGGRLLILEFSMPPSSWIRILHRWYFFKMMPAYGKVVTGEDAPFRYLAESVRLFPSPEIFQEGLKNAGFSKVCFKRLSEGVVSVYFGEKPQAKSLPGRSRRVSLLVGAGHE